MPSNTAPGIAACRKHLTDLSLTKLFGNSACKIWLRSSCFALGPPSILQTSFPNNFVGPVSNIYYWTRDWFCCLFVMGENCPDWSLLSWNTHTSCISNIVVFSESHHSTTGVRAKLKSEAEGRASSTSTSGFFSYWAARPGPTVTLFRSLYLLNRAFDRRAVFFAG